MASYINAELIGLELLLSQDPQKKYLSMNKNKQLCRVSQKPHKDLYACAISKVANEVEHLINTKFRFCLEDYQQQLLSLLNIDKGVMLFKQFHHGKIVNLSNEEKQIYSLFDRVIQKAFVQNEECLNTSVNNRGIVTEMSEINLSDYEEKELYQIAFTAFTITLQEKGKEWALSRKDMLQTLFKWIEDQVFLRKLDDDDLDQIILATEQLPEIFPEKDIFCLFTFGDEVLRVHALRISLHRDFFAPYISKQKVAGMYDLRIFKAVDEYIRTGEIASLKERTIKELLELFDLNYFQKDTYILRKIIDALNEKDLGFYFTINNMALTLTVANITKEVGVVIANSTIQKFTYSLDLGRCKEFQCKEFNDEINAAFEEIIRSLPSLQRLVLPVTPALSEKSLIILRKLPKLKRLYLDFTFCSPIQSCSSLLEGVGKEKKNASWSVSIKHFRQSEKSTSQFLQNYSYINQVTYHNAQTLSDKTLKEIALNLDQVVQLSLKNGVNISSEALIFFLKKHPELRGLFLGQCTHFNEDELCLIIDQLKSEFEQIDLSGATITQEVITTIIEKLPLLSCLSFANCPTVTNEMIEVIANFCIGIEYYDLANCSLSDEGVKAIASSQKKLKKLSLLNCESVTIDSIKNILESCPLLALLNISNTNITEEEKKRIRLQYPSVKII